MKVGIAIRELSVHLSGQETLPQALYSIIDVWEVTGEHADSQCSPMSDFFVL